MTAAGARGKTLGEMQNTMKLKEFQNMKEINTAYKNVLRQIEKTKSRNIVLDIANRIYLDVKFKVLATFKKTLATYYNSDSHSMDIRQPTQTVRKINQWISQKTNGSIKDVIEKRMITKDLVMFLINVIYFKGKWQNPFDPKETRPDKFHLSNGKEIEVPMMSLKGKFKYVENKILDSQILRLDYKGNKVAMYIILPKTTNLKGINSKLNARIFQTVRRSHSTVPVRVKIPKFKLKYKKDLKDDLIKLGIRDLFDDSAADLSGINGELNIVVSKVIHDAVLEVNEEGSKAAAVTTVVFQTKIASILFVANHPFVVIIYHLQLNQILFMGNVNNPSSS